MRFSELSIQTQRSAPSDIRAEGLAFLYRAGYVSRVAEPLQLGKLTLEKLRQALAIPGLDLPGLFTRLALRGAYSDEVGEYFALFESTPSGNEPGKSNRDAFTQEILLCPACGYASRRELARSCRQPFSEEAALPVEKVQTPECSTIAQLALFMQVPPQKTAKALMFTRLQD